MIDVLIIGGAQAAFREAEQASQLLSDSGYSLSGVAVATLNHAGYMWPGKMSHWITLHPELIADWKWKRAYNGFPFDAHVVSHLNKWSNTPERDREHVNEWVDYRYGKSGGSGSSGLIAARYFIEKGYQRILLAGVPMSASGRHLTYDRKWDAGNYFQQAWLEFADELRPFVRSMSGFTRDLLGGPEEYVRSEA